MNASGFTVETELHVIDKPENRHHKGRPYVIAFGSFDFPAH